MKENKQGLFSWQPNCWLIAFSHLHDAEDPEVVGDLLGDLVHVPTDEAHVLLPGPRSVSSHVVLVLKRETLRSVIMVFNG